MLIERCLCGRTDEYVVTRAKATPIAIARCICGVEWLVTEQSVADVRDYYTLGGYHDDEHRHADCVSYTDRYEPDRVTAAVRLERYAVVLGTLNYPKPQGRRWLDVGAANGALVDELRARNFEAVGVEPDARFAREAVLEGGIDTAPGPWDFVSYIDVLEHVPDPKAELAAASVALAEGGLLVVEVPDTAVKAGAKHYKAEHIWYFTLRALVDLVRSVGLEFVTCDFPIPGKLVIYAGKPMLSPSRQASETSTGVLRSSGPIVLARGSSI